MWSRRDTWNLGFTDNKKSALRFRRISGILRIWFGRGGLGFRFVNFRAAPSRFGPTLFPLWVMQIGLIVGASANAQSYLINGHALSGGGGLSFGGAYMVKGTLGEPAAGALGGGNYSISGGFWATISPVQTPGSPLLSLGVTSTNTVVVSWPSPSTGFVLQQSVGGTGTNWVDVSHAPVDNGVTKSVLVSSPAGNLFFRLKK